MIWTIQNSAGVHGRVYSRSLETYFTATWAVFSTSLFMVLFLLAVLELIRPPTSSPESDFSRLPHSRRAEVPPARRHCGFKPQRCLCVLQGNNNTTFPRSLVRTHFLARDLRLYCLFTSSHNICVCEESHPQTRLGLRKIDLRNYSRIKRGRNKKTKCEATSTFLFCFGMYLHLASLAWIFSEKHTQLAATRGLCFCYFTSELASDFFPTMPSPWG